METELVMLVNNALFYTCNCSKLYMHSNSRFFPLAGPIDDNLLKQLSGDLGDEWKMLATHLNVKKTRIQSIMRNHVNCENEPVSLLFYAE